VKKVKLREIYQPIERDLVKVEEEIRKQLRVEDGFMERVMEDIIASPGKLLRPGLALLAFSAGNNNKENKEKIIKIASVIELIHTATLIQDDVIDETILRRHKKTLHSVWGDKISILFGDYLFSRSFTVLSQLGYPEIVNALASTMNIICEGELKQISRAYDWDLAEEDYFLTIKQKTATLFSFSCFCGGHLGKVGANEIKALVNYGLNFGIAFQIIDDCLDFVGDEKVMGKSLGVDLRKGIITLPLIYLLSLVPENTRMRTIELISWEQGNGVIASIREIIQKYQIMPWCLKRVTEYINRAKEETRKIKKMSIRRSFMDMCEYTLANLVETSKIDFSSLLEQLYQI